MFAVLSIAAVSLAFLACWFRYSCGLILRSRSSRTFATYVAELNGLSFLDIESQLSHSDGGPLAKWHDALVSDYRFISYLLFHASEYSFNEQSTEIRILMLDFAVLRLWFPVCRMFSEPLACGALREMAAILIYIANGMGERVAYSSQP